MTVYERLRSAVEERIAVCEAATPGRWVVEVSPFYIVAPDSGVTVCTDQFVRGPDKHHIAAHSPAAMLPLHRAVLAEIDWHGPDCPLHQIEDALCHRLHGFADAYLGAEWREQAGVS